MKSKIVRLNENEQPKVNVTINLTTISTDCLESKGIYTILNQDESKNKSKQVSYSLPTETPLNLRISQPFTVVNY